MYEATTEAVRRARAGEGPTLMEARTYRYEDHSEGLGPHPARVLPDRRRGRGVA